MRRRRNARGRRDRAASQVMTGRPIDARAGEQTEAQPAGREDAAAPPTETVAEAAVKQATADAAAKVSKEAAAAQVSFAVPTGRQRRMVSKGPSIGIDTADAGKWVTSSEPVQKTLKEAVLEKATLGALLAVWYGANIYFNIYNKQVLKVRSFDDDQLRCRCLFAVEGARPWRSVRLPPSNSPSDSHVACIHPSHIPCLTDHPRSTSHLSSPPSSPSPRPQACSQHTHPCNEAGGL